MSKKEIQINKTTNLGDKGVWEGVIKSVLFQDANNLNYSVINFLPKDSLTPIIAEGNITMPQKNALIKIVGEVVKNKLKNDTLQIKVSSSNINASADTLASISFVASDAIPGFTTIKGASDFINYFGTDLELFMKDVKKLKTYPRISENRAKKIKAAYEKNSKLYPLFLLLKGNITYKKAQTIYDKYKDKAVQEIYHNPYKLIYDISGFGFATVDKIALRLGIKYDAEERILAALSNALYDAETGQGHLYLPTKDLIERTSTLIFSLKELVNVYYQDVLLSAAVPDDTSEWELTTLSELVKNSKSSVSIINKILLSWGKDEKRSEYCKKYKFTSEEIDTIDIYYDKKMIFEKKVKDIIVKYSYNAIGMNSQDVVQNLYKFENANKLLVICNGYYKEESVALIKSYIYEYVVAKTFIDSLSSGVIRKVTDADFNKVINDVTSEEKLSNPNFTFDVDQLDAVKLAVSNRISVITGGPGRGKTTIIKTAIKYWLTSRPNNVMSINPAKVLLLAPTGNAAKRLSMSTGYEAKTIHRFLMQNFARKEEDEFDCIKNDDTIIFVDEASMIDIYLLKRLISCTKRAQICLVGDVDQLPSVGPGKILSDIINSGIIPFVKLTSCHRNSGAILDNSMLINKGCKIGELINDNHFRTLWVNDAGTILKNTINIYKNIMDKHGYLPKDIVVLGAMREKSTGINTINKLIQAEINPSSSTKKECKYKGMIFREGDRVIQLKNNYKKDVYIDNIPSLGVFNGDTGSIIGVYEIANELTGEIEETFIAVEFDDGKLTDYTLNELDELELAYALTYHKSQGSEYKAVICILNTSDFILLQRNIIYTGETRAKNICFFIGAAKAFSLALSDCSGKNSKRNTLLNIRLKELGAKYAINKPVGLSNNPE